MRTQGDLSQQPEHEREPAVESKQIGANTPGSELALFQQQLPGAVRTTGELAIYRDFQQLYGGITCTYTEAVKTIDQIRTDKVAMAARHKELRQKTTSALIVRDQSDALENVRKKLKLDDLREDLLAKLATEVSFEEGLAILELAVSKILETKVEGAEEIFRLLPGLTSCEISLLPLLRSVPQTFLNCGTELGPCKEKFPDLANRVAQYYYASSTGVSVITDNFDPYIEDMGYLTADAYHGLGLTGIRAHQEFVDYCSHVRRAVKMLIPLMMSNADLYLNAYNNAQESIQVGLGMVERRALEETLGEQAGSIAAIPVGLAVAALAPEQRAEFNARKDKLLSKVAQSTIFDIAQKRELYTRCVFRLLGLLQYLPAFLFEETPFSGYVVPFGVSVRFLDQDGLVLDQIPFQAMYARNAIMSLHWEAENEDKENRTMFDLFEKLRREAHSKAITRMLESEHPLSVSEQVASKLWLSFGINLEVNGYCELAQNESWLFAATPSKEHLALIKKIGPKESRFLLGLVSLVPPAFLGNVQNIRKEVCTSTAFERLNGMSTIGEYVPEKKRIVLREGFSNLFTEMGPAQRIVSGFTFLHEVGESVWRTLDAKQQDAWTRIAWPRKRLRGELDEHFLTAYAWEKDSREDFCEHFAAFVVHGKEFRERGAKSRTLKRKYSFLRELFFKAAGRELEYPGTELSISSIHGNVLEESKKRDLEEIIERENLDAEENEQAVREEQHDIRISIDEYLESEERELLAEEEGEWQTESEDASADDWIGLKEFERSDENDIDTFDPFSTFNDELSQYASFREQLIENVRPVLPPNSGRLLELCVQIAPLVLERDLEQLEEILRAIKLPRKRRLKVIDHLVALAAKLGL